MRTLLLVLLALVACATARANGVGIVSAQNGTYVELDRSVVEVDIEGQVAQVRTTQTFHNQRTGSAALTYVFPLPDGASATGLRWFINGEWHSAVFSSSPPQGPPGPPGGLLHASLTAYLTGRVPLYFGIDEPLAPGGEFIVELEYVQLLPYAFGAVDFAYPNDYRSIQTASLEEQRLDVTLTSPRTILGLDVLSHGGATTTNDGTTATALWIGSTAAANADYRLRYTLDPEELGLFGFSTMLPDSAVADEGPPGFLLFVAEPDPTDETETIDKVFTLVIDRSGSMIGTKIVQARNAARFIVNNLNEGDLFNIVDFATDVRSFRPAHVPYTPQNRDAALAYINALVASGNTNISGAFSTTIPQFASASDSTANIVVFLTDGVPTTGITATNSLLTHVQNLITQTETGVLLFTFGIGNDVNRQLLALLAQQNSGISEFLDDDELEARISAFYLTIRNPVLLNATVAVSPAVVTGLHPGDLPNLYKGRQMIVSGRYSEAVPVTITLSGNAFGHPVTYAYTLDLAETADPGRLFLTKVWAKLAIEDLLIEYYTLPSTSAAALALREQIIQLSLQFGVLSPFTSLNPTNPPPTTESEESPEQTDAPAGLAALSNSPNPFSHSTTLRFSVGAAVAPQVVLVRIYNTIGQLVRVLTVRVDAPGTYEVVWDGRLSTGMAAPAGVYVYVVEADNAVAAGRMTLVR